MDSPRAYPRSASAHQRSRRRSRAARRWKLAAILVGTAVIVLLLLAAFNSPSTSFQASLREDATLLSTDRPLPQVIAFQGSLAIQLPVSQRSVTALGYHGASQFALALKPVGRQANEGLFSRIVHGLFGGRSHGVSYYQLGGGGGASTSALDIGAPAGTSVYAPVGGTIVSIRDFVLNGRRYGHRIELAPSESAAVVVSLTRLRVDPALSVGSRVTAGTSKIGVVLDLSRVEKQELAKVTHDPGNHLTLEVHPAEALPFG